MKDFIITSLQTWDIEIGSTIKNTALEISKQNRVLYINTPMDYSTRLKGNKQAPSYIRRMSVIKGEASPLRQINKNMWVLDCPFTLLSVNFLPAPLFNFFNRQNNRRIGRWIVQQAAQPRYSPRARAGRFCRHCIGELQPLRCRIASL